ncbi:hypothetical protein ACFXAZ_13425 [Streptomyces sp. NPDC059477]|uniref:YqeB family protein n=1 Tax=Streptomyces sp. NPDC059477 TaxID=3346847 RepID=UPI0036BA4C7F
MSTDTDTHTETDAESNMAQRQQPKTTDDHTSTVAEPAWATVLFCVACGAAGGWLTTALADWFTTLRWAPLKGPAELLNSIPEPGLTLGAITGGALLGVLVGFIAVHESLTVHVSRSRVTITVRDTSEEFTPDQIEVALRDGKQLVLLSPNGLEIAREDSGLPWHRVAEAFTEHGYTWSDEDPYGDNFRRWVPGTPGLPEGADALLIARAAARKNDDSTDARELRRDLIRLGVVVRDEGKRQYWRIPN